MELSTYVAMSERLYNILFYSQ